MATFWANATFKCNGTSYSPGDELSTEDAAAIPNIDGFIESGWIVADDAAGLLPNAANVNRQNEKHLKRKPAKKAAVKKAAPAAKKPEQVVEPVEEPVDDEQ